jgi:hypothetical protein
LRCIQILSPRLPQEMHRLLLVLCVPDAANGISVANGEAPGAGRSRHT